MSKRLAFKALIFIFSLSLISGNAPAQTKKNRFGTKLTGGMGYSLFDDLHAWRNGEDQYQKLVAQKEAQSVQGRFREFHVGFDIEGDLMIFLSRRLGIILGTGYIYAHGPEGKNKITRSVTDGTWTISFDDKAAAIPVRLGLFGIIPLFSAARIILNAGAGYYFAEWSNTFKREGRDIWINDYQKAKGSGIGYQGGVAFEFDIFRNVSFIIETGGRYAKIRNFKGDFKHQDSEGNAQYLSGDLDFYEYYSSYVSRWFPWIAIQKHEFSESIIRGYRKGSIDFSGLSVRSGIKIQF